MTGYGAGDAFTAVAQATKEAGQAQQVGELVMALLTAIAVLVSALLVFVSLCVQAVIIYLSSAVFAVGWVWVVTGRHRETAWRIPRMFVGIVFSKALLFFLLGVAMAIAAASTAMTGDGIARNLGLIVMACAAMLLAAFAPLILLRHAPVIPGTSTSREVADTVSAAGRAGRSAGRAAGRAPAAGRAGVQGGSKLVVLAAKSRQDRDGTELGGGSRATWSGTGGAGSSADTPTSRTAGAGAPASPSPGGTTAPIGSTGTGGEPGTGAAGGRPGRPAPARPARGTGGSPGGGGRAAPPGSAGAAPAAGPGRGTRRRFGGGGSTAHRAAARRGRTAGAARPAAAVAAPQAPDSQDIAPPEETA